MRKSFFSFTLFLLTKSIFKQVNQVIEKDGANGMKLSVNGKDFFINGINWNYFPNRTNFSYSLWKQSDYIIIAALDKEMPLHKNMTVNVIRQYTGVPDKWTQRTHRVNGFTFNLFL